MGCLVLSASAKTESHRFSHCHPEVALEKKTVYSAGNDGKLIIEAMFAYSSRSQVPGLKE